MRGRKWKAVLIYSIAEDCRKKRKLLHIRLIGETYDMHYSVVHTRQLESWSIYHMSLDRVVEYIKCIADSHEKLQAPITCFPFARLERSVQSTQVC